MSKIEINSFSGIRPVISADKLANNEAQTANNCKLRSGAIETIASDIPAAPTYGFSYVDGFGTWTHAAGEGIKLNGTSISQSAPSTPTVTSNIIFDSADITNPTFTLATAINVAGSITNVSSAGSGELIEFNDAGDKLRLSYRVSHTGYIGNPFGPITGGIFTITALTTDSITMASTAFSEPGQTASIAGGLGTIRLDNVVKTRPPVGWDSVKTGSGVQFWVKCGSYTVTFEFTLNFTTAINSERSVVYRVSNLESSGIESPASAATALAVIGPNRYATISGLGTAKKKRIYRAAGNEENAKYYFVAELAAATATYNDFVSDAALGDVMPEIENPPAAMTQVVRMPGGYLAGFNSKDIYFSDPFILYSWNTDYILTSQYSIVGLAVSGNDLIVLTGTKHYVISGTTPDITSMSELMVTQDCVSLLSICKVGTRIGFVSSDGFVVLSGGTAQNITEPFYNKTQWSALLPVTKSGIAAIEYDNRVYIYMTASSGIVIDYLSKIVTTFSGGGAGSFTWKSKVYGVDLPMEMHVAKMTGDAGTNTLKMYADGVEVYSGTITNNVDLPLTRGMAEGLSWEFQLEGSTKVETFALIHRDNVMVHGGLRIDYKASEGSWLRLIYQHAREDAVTCVRIHASVYPVIIKLYRAHGKTAFYTRTVHDQNGFWLPKFQPARQWEMDVTATDGVIYEVSIAKSMAQLRGQ